MNTALLISLIAAVLTAIGHSLIGEKKILGPLYAERIGEGVLQPAATRRILRAVWSCPDFVDT